MSRICLSTGGYSPATPHSPLGPPPYPTFLAHHSLQSHTDASRPVALIKPLEATNPRYRASLARLHQTMDRSLEINTLEPASPNPQRTKSDKQSEQRPRMLKNVQTRRKTTFSNPRKSMLNPPPRGHKNLPRKQEQHFHSTVIYTLSVQVQPTPGSPSQVWRRIAKPACAGVEIRWALGPRGFKSHSRRHHT